MGIQELTLYQMNQMALGNDSNYWEWMDDDEVLWARYDLAAAIITGEV